MEFRVWGLGFRLYDLGIGVWGFGSGVQRPGNRNYSLGLRFKGANLNL